MRILKFNLQGSCATFKKPHINMVQLTYSHIHKVALLGLLGAIMGKEGYRQKKAYNEEIDSIKKLKKEYMQYPQFYQDLKNLKIAIQPKEAYLGKSIRRFSDTTCFGNDGNTVIIDEQILINPSWNIYISEEDWNKEIINELFNRLKNKEFEYEPYFGRNHFFAEIEEVELLEGEIFNSEDLDESIQINSLFRSDIFKELDNDKVDELIEDLDEFINLYKSEEYYPVSISSFLNSIMREIYIY